MFTMGVPKYPWGETTLIASYFINRMTTWVLKFEIPLNSLLKVFAHTLIFTILSLRVFNCVAFVPIHKQNCSKLDPHVVNCVFLGYSLRQKGQKCCNSIFEIFLVGMNVTFFENQSFFTKDTI